MPVETKRSKKYGNEIIINVSLCRQKKEKRKIDKEEFCELLWKKYRVITMNNTSSASVGSSTAVQNPLIIRMNYPRPLIDRKPDDEASRVVMNGAQSSASATVPQIVSILNPTITNMITTGAASVNGGTVPNAKKCTFHRQCLHIQSPQSQQQAGQQQQTPVSQHIQQIQLPLTTPPQLLHHHPQLLQHAQQQQQIRIGNSQIPTNSCPTSAAVAAGIAAVNRASAQPNRDAISTNTTPQLNAALLQDRYLLLDLVDGSSFYKCIDIQTQKMLVCKVRRRTKHVCAVAYVSSELTSPRFLGWAL